MAQTLNPAAAFAAAERAFLEGRFGDARAILSTIAWLGHPAAYHLRAIVEQELGDLAEARRQFEAATRLSPRDPQLWSNFALLLEQQDDTTAALDAYERALELQPRYNDVIFNRAVLLTRLGRRGEARTAFRSLIEMNPRDPRCWNGLAAVEKASGALAAAAAAYDRALAASHGDRLATIGRARIALERQEADAVARYRAARRLAPDDRELALDEVEARLDRGDREALDDFAKLARSAPDWTHGQIALARMRWEQGAASGYADHIEALLEQKPGRDQLWSDYIQLVANCGEPARAADLARRARDTGSGEVQFQLAEAIHAGKAGQIDRAEALFATLPPGLPGRELNESVHRIRTGDLDRAIALIETVLDAERWNLAAWGIAELLYRKTGHERGPWLSGQPGLVSVLDLPLDQGAFHAAGLLLAGLHRDAVETVGQSVRGGTQTRWNLFDRAEPELATLQAAIDRALGDHITRLPTRDDEHPLLRHRDRALVISASWSVRFVDAGQHVAHYHPSGLISSACYFRTPSAAGDHDGWLEIGRPPADFLLDLEPIQMIEPRPGRLVLFPSYLFHGTRPFSAGERMSVAFDVVAANGDG
ncbi:putative 2OG-Fe(II) oxygenase [Sphingosinicella sp.]|uniref:putative 2OG-Fe(II) oxygenase n=1 Tax=Sphingosinicella sp. TaxID=1917971 RepID=UPI0040381E8E